MINYTTQTNKNGKTIYYRVTDGKKKQISHDEYEANHTEEIQSTVIEPKEIENSALALVKNILEAESENVYDLHLQNTKNYALIKYGKYVIAALIYNQSREVSGIGFMGFTTDTRNKITKYQINGLEDIIIYSDEILEQVIFINDLLNTKSA